MTAEQLEELLTAAPSGPWDADRASGEINGGESGCYPVIDMNIDTYDRVSACVQMDDSEWATLQLCALAPTLARCVIAAEKLVELVEQGECPWREDTRNYREWWAERKEAATAYREASK